VESVRIYVLRLYRRGDHRMAGLLEDAQTALNHAVAFSNKPSGPFDHYGAVCVVVYNTNKTGHSAANGHCESTDVDGHKWYSSFNDDGNKMAGSFEATGGTGKYEGLKLSGEFKPIGPLFVGTPGHIMRCMNVTGTYKLR
jgi:hypothetical protein